MLIKHEDALRVLNGESIDLENNLVLRIGTANDIDAISKLNEDVQGEGNWSRILASGDHPNINYANFSIVEDKINNMIVSSVCYITQTWTYGEVNLQVARVDMVSTLLDYRLQGLTRRQFEIIHKICDLKGVMMEVLVGRPWIYRKFGYDMAIRYWNTHLISKNCKSSIINRRDDMFNIRLAKRDDISYCTELFKKMRKKFPLTCIWEEKNWMHDIFDRKESDLLKLSVIENKYGLKVGSILHSPYLDESNLIVFLCELEADISWLDVTPCMVQYLYTAGEKLAEIENTDFNGFNFSLRDNHPIFDILGNAMTYESKSEAPFSWYVRVSDIAKLVLCIAPELEKRLENSYAIGYSGKLELSFYQPGFGLVVEFENGRIISAENMEVNKPETSFPVEYFKQLIFGYKALCEIEKYCPEVRVSHEARIILNILFPKKESYILSIC